MAQEHLGLFDTPPDRHEIRIGLIVVGTIIVILLAALPRHDLLLGSVRGFMPALGAGTLVCDLITAAILYAQAAVFRSRALTVLASGYVFGGLLFIPYTLTFPGAFAEHGLLGAKVNTTAWIAAFWRMSVPVSVLAYAWLKRADVGRPPIAERPPAKVLLGALVAVVLVVSVVLLTTLGHDLLPAFFLNRSEVVRPMLVIVNLAVIALTLSAMAMLFRQDRSVLDMWLLVALFAWLAQSLLNMILSSRFCLGAYLFFALMLVSNLNIMLALVTESIRLYARLALSTAARNRERDARLMSMDAVAAAIDHEVGQPLTAAKLAASTALTLLTAPKPDAKAAVRALHDSLDANQRTFDVIKSLRTTFAKDAKALSEFDLNDLVRETELLMDRELAAEHIALRHSLDETLPPIRANRIQVQRVLINLLSNAIESVAAARGRTRFIAIHSAPLDDRFLCLDVSDSGIGIAPERLPQIFDAFYTTKSSGAGLGLSLCRTIVEEHGGRLWASAGPDCGATFHMQLPLGRISALRS